MDATEANAKLVLAGKAKFSGDAGLYGTLDAAMKPTTENTKSKAELVANMILGKKTATDLIFSHFFALQDPYSKDTF